MKGVKAIHHVVLMAAVGLATAASPALAWEAKVFGGTPENATTSDLRQRKAAAGETFYAENYAFTLQLTNNVRGDVKFGMTNVLGGKGGAFSATTFSARGYPYFKDKRSISPSKWSYSDAPFSVDLKSVSLSGDDKKLKLTLRNEKVEVAMDLVAVVPGWKPGTGKIEVPGQGFIEVIVWPKMTVSGWVTNKANGRRLMFTGHCVMTHAVTTLPPQHQPPRWYYFRGNDLANPVLFQAVQLGEQFGGKLYGWYLVVENDRIVAGSNMLTLTPTDVRPREKVSLAWGMYFKDALGKSEGAVKASVLKRAVDRLAGIPKFEAAILRKFIQPRMYLFDGDMEIAVGGTKTYKASGVYKIETIRD